MSDENGGEKKEQDPLDQIKNAVKTIGFIKQAAAALNLQLVPIQQAAGGQQKLNVGVVEKEGKVLIDFGRELRWCAMEPAEATKFVRQIAAVINSMKEKADADPEGATAQPENEADSKEVDNT